MKIQLIHKTRKAAAAYLIARGWAHTRTSLGDWVFTHTAIRTHQNVIVQLRNGTWQIQAWGIVV